VDPSNPGEVRPRITPIQRLSTLPEGWSGTNYVGEIKVDAGGRHVYVSNRGHHSIATFKVRGGGGGGVGGGGVWGWGWGWGADRKSTV
jgi:6-phosphogluconolactonase